MCLDIDEGPSERTDRPIEIGRLGGFEIYEKAPDPWGEKFLEKGPVGAVWRRNVTTDQTRHYFAEKSGMVFGLDSLWHLLDAKALECFPNSSQGAAVQRVGQVVRGIRQNSIVPQPGEQRKKLARYTFFGSRWAFFANAV